MDHLSRLHNLRRHSGLNAGRGLFPILQRRLRQVVGGDREPEIHERPAQRVVGFLVEDAPDDFDARMGVVRLLRQGELFAQSGAPGRGKRQDPGKKDRREVAHGLINSYESPTHLFSGKVILDRTFRKTRCPEPGRLRHPACLPMAKSATVASDEAKNSTNRIRTDG